MTLSCDDNETYKITVVPTASTKFELTADETKLTVKKNQPASVTFRIKFTHYITMGLTGQVQFHIQKKSLIGGDLGARALRFQFQGMIPEFHAKDLVKKSDEEQFNIGTVKGELALVKNETFVAFCYKPETDDPQTNEFAREDFAFVKNVYRNMHHPAILGMVGIIHPTMTILLDSDTVCDLEQLMEKEKLSIPFLLQCVSDCAEALNYLASHRIVHRNVKPSKLRVVRHDITNEGKCIIKLNDLSTVAKVAEPNSLKRSPGTYAYMAPEVMECKPHGLPIDVFSFAMTLYHIFSYETPYGTMSNFEVQEFVCAGKVRPRPPLTPSASRCSTSSPPG